MKTKQFFSIMVLVGIAFAGVAFAGPTALPPSGGGWSLPIYGKSPAANQSKVGTAPSGNQVAHALAVGPELTGNSTLYVSGGIAVFGSLSNTSDSMSVLSNLDTSNLYMNNTSSTQLDSLYVSNVNTTNGTSKPLCIDGQYKKVKLCQ